MKKTSNIPSQWSHSNKDQASLLLPLGMLEFLSFWYRTKIKHFILLLGIHQFTCAYINAFQYVQRSGSSDLLLLLQVYKLGCFDLKCCYRTLCQDKRIFLPSVRLLPLWRCVDEITLFVLCIMARKSCLTPNLYLCT